MLRPANLNGLRMFDAAARFLNFRLAAEELHLTQGAVARQVRKLENSLGCRLFHRKARGLALTDNGRDYHASIRQALAIIDAATHKLQPQSTRLKLSVPPSFASKWLVPRLAGFSADHPDIALQIVASEELADFNSDTVDVAVRIGSPPFSNELQVDLLERIEYTAVCSPAFAERTGNPATLAEFSSQPLIQDAHNLWEVTLREAGLSIRQRWIQFNQTAHAIDAAANHQGIALAPQLLVADDINRETLVVLGRFCPQAAHGYYVVRPHIRGDSPAATRLIDWLLMAIRD